MNSNSEPGNNNSKPEEQTMGIVPYDQEGTEAYTNYGNEISIFREYVLKGRWGEVISRYGKESYYHKMMINKSRGTALHVAINSGGEELVNKLVRAIVKHEGEELGGESALWLRNERGDTPLHLAAYRGLVYICKCIIGENGERKDLIKVRNIWGETPLFCAVLTCQRQTFAYLYDVSKSEAVDVPLGNSEVDVLRNNYGDSILHLAIRREFFDLAVIIIHCYPKLTGTQNKDGVTPLKTLVTRPSAFRSGSNLTWWNQILYQCITVEPLDAEKEINSYLDVTKVTIQIEKEIKEAARTRVLSNTVTFLRSVFNTIWSALGGRGLSQLDISVVDMLYLKKIKMIKQKHEWGNQLLKAFMQNPYESYVGSTGGGQQPFGKDDLEDIPRRQELEKDKKQSTEAKTDEKDTTFLTAVKNGIVEIVDVLLWEIPSVVNESNSNNENALLLAVKNKQPHVFMRLQQILDKKLFDSLIFEVDNNANTVLHLAASTGNNSEKSWGIGGATMQMMWDLTWYQYIKELVPEHFMIRNNMDDKTAGESFKENHKDLMKNSSESLKETSVSCSAVAIAIAGISFTTATTAPGGTENGKPKLEGQPVFDTFAMASLITLSSSVTALVMFLSIFTSRKQAEDFRRSLPMKLLFGMSSLFVSIASLLVSFCAAQFFVLKDKYKSILFPIYVATCLPATFFAVVQFPLYVDLVKTIFKKVPQRSYRSHHL